MKKWLLILSILPLLSKAQYNPSREGSGGIVLNNPAAPAQQIPVDARSYYHDINLHVWRYYQSTTEALTWIPSIYRMGNFPVFVSTGTLQSSGVFIGGQVFEYMWRNGISDSNLVLINIDQGASGNFLQIANNLSDVASVATARTNLGLGAMAQQNLTASSADVTGNWPSGLIVNSIQGHNLAFIQNYNNLSNTPTIPAQVNLTG